MKNKWKQMGILLLVTVLFEILVCNFSSIKTMGNAEKIIADDDAVDEYFIEVRQWLRELIGSKPSEAEAALDILMTAKYLERIADHAVNIARWVIFSVSGIYKGENL